MINERDNFTDEFCDSEDSSDKDDQLNKRDFTDKDLAKLAVELLEDWVFILLELDLKLNEIKQIENLYPRDIRRQALEGLIVWQRRSESPYEHLLKACKEYKREDIIDVIRRMQGKHAVIGVIRRMQGSSEISNKRKRCKSCTFEQIIETKKRRTAIIRKRDNILDTCGEIETVPIEDFQNNRDISAFTITSVKRHCETEDGSELNIFVGARRRGG